MKKALLTIVFILSIFFIKAQSTKPSKEETIKYMANTLKNVEGNIVEVKDISGECTIIKYFFDGVSFVHSNYYPSTENNTHYDETETNIKWETCDSDLLIERPVKTAPYTFIYLHFQSKIKHTYRDQKEYREGFFMYIPNDKLASFKKAILRLIEITKEENKDPFKN